MPKYVLQEPHESNRVDQIVVATIKTKLKKHHVSLKSGGDCILQILPLLTEMASRCSHMENSMEVPEKIKNRTSM